MTVAFDGRLVLSTLVTDAVLTLSRQLVEVIGDDEPDPGPRVVPRDLRLWLARLRLLSGVPFGHLVADAELLPPESIRFFYLDRDWTDALVQGALSVGTVTTADRAQLTRLHGRVRDEVDEAERLVRLPGVEAGAAVPVGPAGTISGFVLRSRMVSGWPGLHVRGYGVDNLTLTPTIPDAGVRDEDGARLQRLGLLRLERLAPAVLIALFDGVPAVVHVEEPRAGIQFGVDEKAGAGGSITATVRPRTMADGTPLPGGTDVPVPFRPGAPGVVHVAALTRRLIDANPALGPGMDPAEFAVQMLQFPFRAVFGDRTLDGGAPVDPAALFSPRISAAALVRRFGGLL